MHKYKVAYSSCTTIRTPFVFQNLSVDNRPNIAAIIFDNKKNDKY